MTYLFTTPEQQREMLDVIGVTSIDDLFAQVPDALQLKRPLNLPPAMTEMPLEAEIRRRAAKNVAGSDRVCFLGGGVYDHFIPSAVDEVVSRGEYYTAYTPYQAEASQGSLQAFFEYQSLICQLTGMDVSNASLYEGGTAVSEAAFMAMRQTRRHDRVVVLGSVHPEFVAVTRTYLTHLDCDVVVVPVTDDGVLLDDIRAAVDDRTACVIAQQPNFLGSLEDVAEIASIAHENGALFVVSVDPISLGLLKRPGSYGADIVVAEGQSLGIPLQYGGPFLGIMACRQEFMRKMPGRLIGQTVDRHGKRCFALNLQAREQHIRREKATSNICTNQGLLALRATVFLSLLGPQGLKEVASLCCRKAHYLAERLEQVGIHRLGSRPFVRELAVSLPDADRSMRQAREAGFDIGPDLKRFDIPGRDGSGLLIAVTEKRTRAEIDALVEALAS